MPDSLVLCGSFPLQREQRFITRLNHLESGTEYRGSEQLGARHRWELELRNRSDSEVDALEQFFRAAEGRYAPFAFLDPLENLLLWSEDFGQVNWEKSAPAAFGIDRDLPDPAGGNAAQRLNNSSAAWNFVTQWIEAAPPDAPLTGSVWARAAVELNLVLALAGQFSTIQSAPLKVSSVWQRFTLGGVLASGSARFGWQIEIPPASSVELFGAQLMALPSAGAYARTTTTSGFHPLCRFGSDVFPVRANGPGDADLRLVVEESL